MAFDLNALAGKTALAKVDYMGQSAILHYDPNVLTAANVNRAQRGGDEGFKEVFCALVKNWDVKAGARKVPITPKGLETIPLPFLKACFLKIVRMDSDDVSAEGKDSDDS